MSTPIIKSVLDNDIYKFSTQAFALELFPDVKVQYRFQNRGEQRFNQEFLEELNGQIKQELPRVRLRDYEYDYLKMACPYLKRSYLEYLKNFKFDPSQVCATLTDDNNLDLKIDGLWCDTALWEVPLMAIISELYFKMISTNWTMDGQRKLAEKKAVKLVKEKIKYAEFGTRRRRNSDTQSLVVKAFKYIENMHKFHNSRCFVGTSNVYFAMEYGLIPIGSVPHEIIMGMSALESLNHADYYAMHNWSRIFDQLGTALTDTYGTDSFLRNFNLRFMNLFNSVRCDSGDELEFTDKIVNHYKKHKIDPMTKTIIFSNALDVDKCIKINKYCKNKIQCSFGIGTFFSNDFTNSPALNMVIKLWAVQRGREEKMTPVVKLSDDKDKGSGDPEMLKVMKYIHKGIPLDKGI